MPWAFKDLKADLARLLNQDLGDLQGKEAELEVRKVIDRTDLPHANSDKFYWELWLVAGSGFFTTGFSLVATNSITPLLQLPMVKPFFGPAPAWSLAINTLTLSGMLVGQVAFGILSDVKGRTFAYGVELLIVILGTIGMATSSITFSPFWRLILGVGLGAEYSLSAIIVAEWSSTRWRSFSMAAVLLLHWLGQVMGALAVFAISQTLFPDAAVYPDPTDHDRPTARDSFNVMDKTWRVAVLVSLGFALVAIIFRPLVPETPLWAATHRNLDENRRGQAVFSAAPAESDAKHVDDHDDNTAYEDITRTRRVKTFLKGLRAYLSDQHRLWAFVGISTAWFAIDLAYCGIGFEIYHTIQLRLHNPGNETKVIEVVQPWIHQWGLYHVVAAVVFNLRYRCPGSLMGGLLASALVDRVYRVRWMGWCFITLSAMFLGQAVIEATQQVSPSDMERFGYSPLTIFSNIGPNTVLFILAAEVFGTEYRGTLYGLAAAAGKLGALVSQPEIAAFVAWSELSDFSELLSDGVQRAVLSAVMLVAALVTWAWIPETQLLEPRKRWLAVVQNRTLEDIAQDPCGHQQLGISQIWRRAFGLRRPSMRQPGHQKVEDGPRDEVHDNHGHRDASSSPGAQEEVDISELAEGHRVSGWRSRHGGQGIRDGTFAFGDHQGQNQNQHTDHELPDVFELAFVPARMEHTWI